MNPRCPYYKPPKIAVDYERDKVYEGMAMCELNDKWCLKEEDMDCEIYNEFLEEQGD